MTVTVKWNNNTYDNTVDLGADVEILLDSIGETENSYGETYAETAKRIQDDDEKSASLLRAAETAWLLLG